MPRETLFTAEVEIEGITPLLHHKVVLPGLGPGGGKGITNQQTSYEDEWKSTTYTDASKNVVIPSLNMEAMLRDASKGQRIGKNYLSKMVPSGTGIVEFDIPILVSGKTFTIEDIEKNNWLLACAAVVQGKRIVRVRTAIPPGWRSTFHVRVYNRLITKEVLYSILDRGGYDVGLLDWRPGSPKPGKFGQFEVVNFNV